MNAHITSDHTKAGHWMGICIEKIEHIFTNPKLWSAIGIFALLAALYILAYYAGSGKGQINYGYGFPSYPALP